VLTGKGRFTSATSASTCCRSELEAQPNGTHEQEEWSGARAMPVSHSRPLTGRVCVSVTCPMEQVPGNRQCPKECQSLQGYSLTKDARALLFQQVPSYSGAPPFPLERFSLRLRPALGVRDPSLGLRSRVLGPFSRPPSCQSLRIFVQHE
jgi:hypothetical protein